MHVLQLNPWALATRAWGPGHCTCVRDPVAIALPVCAQRALVAYLHRLSSSPDRLLAVNTSSITHMLQLRFLPCLQVPPPRQQPNMKRERRPLRWLQLQIKFRIRATWWWDTRSWKPHGAETRAGPQSARSSGAKRMADGSVRRSRGGKRGDSARGTSLWRC